MLTGSRAFDGKTVSDTMAAILKEEPDWKALPESTPSGAARVVRRCLVKDPRQRLHDIADARIEIQEAEATPSTGADTAPSAAQPAGSLRGVAWAASIVATVALTWLAVGLSGRGSPTPVAASGSELSMRQLTGRPPGDTVHSAALSPDGEQLAIVTREGLFLQIVATGEERQLPLPGELQILEVDWIGATDLLFSASTADAFGLYKTSIFGGSTRKLTDGAWRAAVSADGAHIAYLQAVPSRVLTVSGPDGEDPRDVLDLGVRGSMWEIAWSPDGRWLLVGIWGGGVESYDTVLEAVDLASGERKAVLEDARFFQHWRGFLPFFWTSDDRLVVGRSEPPPGELMANLWQAPIDRSTDLTPQNGSRGNLTIWVEKGRSECRRRGTAPSRSYASSGKLKWSWRKAGRSRMPAAS